MTENSQKISFTKMQGAGNDFVIIDNRSQQYSRQQLIELAPKICDRNFGVGADGIMALFPNDNESRAYTMFYRNPDGSDAGMCGNGARCMALFAHSLDFDARHTFNVHKQTYEAEILSDHTARISFPMTASIEKLEVDNRTLYATYTGTEHIVCNVERPVLEKEEQLRKTGSRLRNHQRFAPKGTNVNFISGVNEKCLLLQTYERGVEDLTLACGTGAIASALVWHYQLESKSAEENIKVQTKGGSLNVHFSYDAKKDEYANIQLEGPAHFVFTGEYFV